jgi:hypothetical protein
LLTSFDGFTDAGGVTADAGALDVNVSDASLPDGNPSDVGLDASADVVGKYRAAILSDSPLAYWPLDETDASIVSDVSGHGYTAIVQGGVTLGVGGALPNQPPNNAAHFDGTGSLNAQNYFDFGGTPIPFTIEAWFREPQTSSGYPSIFQKLDGSRTGSWAYCHDSYCQYERWDSGTSNLFSVGGSIPSLAGRFIHYAVTFDGLAYQVYVGGQPFNSQTTNAVPPVTQGPFLWGFQWNGELDELAIYDKALSPERILAHFAAAAP